MKKGKVYITLKSDLCVASGYSYAGLIDTDICYDKNGLPYIPARRLKGCFRETAESILYSIISSGKTEEIFGKAGDAIGGLFSISNARLIDFDEIVKEVQIINRSRFVNTQKILEQFTHVVAQTEIQEGVAKDSSLRYTRVVNRFSPITKDENCFVADITFDGKIEEELSTIIKATRNIGLKRNRGFGAVKCELKDVYENVTELQATGNSEDEWKITYSFVNDEPLMLSSMSNTHSEKYINGQSILGFLAGEYLKREGKSAETEEFKDLFLNGSTKYCNAYPSVDGKIFYPAPLYYNKLKKTKDIVNTYYDFEPGEAGNQPKKLKGYFVDQGLKEDKLTVLGLKEVDMKLHYHNRRSKGDEEGKLYSSEAIEPGAEFTGEIIVKEKYKALLCNLLNDSKLTFGKSKGAQYGHCHLVENAQAEKNIANQLSIDKDTEIVVTLLADAVFLGTTDYTVNVDEVSEVLANQLGVSKENIDKNPMIETGLVSGYQSKWNMHKSLIPYVSAGSSFVFKTDKETLIDRETFVGSKNGEGFGLVRVDRLDEFKDNSKNEAVSDLSIASATSEKADFAGVNLLKNIFINILKEDLLTALLKKRMDGSNVVLKNVDNTQVGRAVLMLKQSCASNVEKDEQFANFEGRINSIKNENVKSALLKELIKPIEKDKHLSIQHLIETSQSDFPDLIEQLNMIVKDEFDSEVNDIWADYTMQLLTNRKYLGGKANE